ncbi:MAG: B12-binding domain-containing radical SAM protein, partial [Candidatus Delongbacteria bacterium]
MQTLLISPPFSQLNTPYASIPLLKGYLKTNGVSSSVFDLGIKTAQRLYSKQGLERLKENIVRKKIQGDAAEFFTINFEAYVNTIETVTSFLKGEDPEAKNIILSGKYLPVWKMSLSALDKNTANLSGTEYAQYLASLYLEDIFLFYRSIFPEYGFSSYAEKLALSPPVFDGIKSEILKKNDLMDKIIEEELQKSGFEYFEIIAFTIPFPGMLIGALKAANFIKMKDPDKIIVMGGGYINTELRRLTDPGIFNFADFICLDDGELPLLKIIEYAKGKTDKDQLVRTYCSEDGKVKFYDNPGRPAQIKRGTPDYSDLDMSDYIPVFESVNPMMRLWSEKNTLKIRLAKGCYWHKCNFCDTSLPYISDYSPEKIDDIVDDIRKMTAQTKLTRFHFTDEAIPPASAIRLALELLRQNIKISWWGNIRFDKAFTEDVCRLLKQSGFTAAVGGLESGCRRTLLSMNKGVSVEHAVSVIKNFKSAGILVHVYMIYGFPTETTQDLIDSAEVLRQLFEAGLIDSAFWHRFALTVHSPVFRDREQYNISVPHPEPKPFA